MVLPADEVGRGALLPRLGEQPLRGGGAGDGGEHRRERGRVELGRAAAVDVAVAATRVADDPLPVGGDDPRDAALEFETRHIPRSRG